MKTYRAQSFQKFAPVLLKDGRRSPIAGVDRVALRRIQRGVMNYAWKGVPCLKTPFDMALYTKLLSALRPATIIEIGYKFGGSALWFADQCAALGLETRLFCVDIEQREQVEDPRIVFVHGDARNLAATLTPERLATLPKPWLVVEDADHHYVTTKAALEFLAGVLSEGDYLTVEDGICDSMDNAEHYDGGPNRAIFDFMERSPSVFEVDAEYCDFYGYNVTWCTNGWLRRSAEPYS